MTTNQHASESSLSTDQLIDLVIPPANYQDPTPATDQAPPVYWVNVDATFTPRRGFETVLYRSILETPRSESEIIAELLSSGDYLRVAPRAAELRPAKPTRFLLKTWAAQGILRRSN